MPDEARYPTLEEFWRRLELRDVEPDLQAALRERMQREERGVHRVGAEATVVAVAARILPGDVPARALAAFVDEAYDRPLGRADDRAGLMPREQLIPEGFALLDRIAAERRDGATFAALEADEQDALLAQAEAGELHGPERFSSSEWFNRVRDLLLRGFGADPRGMVQMGYPGPSYKPGHVWLDQMEVERRAQRAPGYLRL